MDLDLGLFEFFSEIFICFFKGPRLSARPEKEKAHKRVNKTSPVMVNIWGLFPIVLGLFYCNLRNLSSQK